MLVTCCLLCVACCLLLVACWWMPAVCCWLFGACCALFVCCPILSAGEGVIVDDPCCCTVDSPPGSLGQFLLLLILVCHQDNCAAPLPSSSLQVLHLGPVLQCLQVPPVLLCQALLLLLPAPLGMPSLAVCVQPRQGDLVLLPEPRLAPVCTPCHHPGVECSVGSSWRKRKHLSSSRSHSRRRSNSRNKSLS